MSNIILKKLFTLLQIENRKKVIKKIKNRSSMWDIGIKDSIKDIFDNDKDVYIYAAKMIDDFFKSHNFRNEEEAKKSIGLQY